jgi:hypothetical protein
MRITKDDARLLSAAMYDAKFDFVKDLRKEQAINIITELKCLENSLAENSFDKRRQGRKSQNDFSDVLKRYKYKKCKQ